MTTRHDWTHLGRFLIPLLLGALALGLPAVAGAATTGGIGGTVTEEGGGPVAGVSVCAESIGVTAEEDFGCDETRTDGTYEILGLEPGEYAVEFWPRELNYAWQYYDGKHSWKEATPVTVASGNVTTGIGAVLEAGATISGTVTSAATGQPVREVEACAIVVGEGFAGCAATATNGTYTIERLAPGEYEVYFYAEYTGQNLLSQKYAGGTITLGTGEARTGINAALQTGGQIQGTVRSAATNSGLAGVKVCLTEAAALRTLGCLSTGSSGAYGFYGVWSASFKVVFSPELSDLIGAEASEYPESEEEFRDSYPTQWWNGQGSFAAATPISVTAPATVTGIDALLGTPPTSTPATTSSPPVTAVPKKRPPRCRHGFVRRKVKGKVRCVRRHKPVRHHHKKHRRHSV